jgi:hypothetical protein
VVDGENHAERAEDPSPKTKTDTTSRNVMKKEEPVKTKTKRNTTSIQATTAATTMNAGDGRIRRHQPITLAQAEALLDRAIPLLNATVKWPGEWDLEKGWPDAAGLIELLKKYPSTANGEG